MNAPVKHEWRVEWRRSNWEPHRWVSRIFQTRRGLDSFMRRKLLASNRRDLADIRCRVSLRVVNEWLSFDEGEYPLDEAS